MVCWWRDGLDFATSTSRRPLRSHQPLGQASFLPGREGKGVISGNLQEKMLHGSTFVFGVASRFDAADIANGWLDGGRSALQAEWTASGGCWLAVSLDDAFEQLDCHTRRVRCLSCEVQTLSVRREPALPKGAWPWP
jgi:hypothetical protein